MLREEAVFRSGSREFSRYILSTRSTMLSTNAFNALLKILEEPPEPCDFYSGDDGSA
jgi:DNA polymerase III gamma/tau subunit